MAMFGCDYLETIGGVISLSYRCKYSRQELSRRTAEDICMTNRYQDCADYKNAAGCFITSAVCRENGKSDNCEELQYLRRFRDGWLRQQPDGKALIEEYYRIAPEIVKAIDNKDDKAAIYQSIYDSVIVPCVEKIKEKDFESCKSIYTTMVENLKNQYLVLNV